MIEGSITALITPFNSENEINYPLVHLLLQNQIENHTDGIVLLGTTAEAESLSDIEKRALVKDSIDYIQGKMKIIIGIIANQPQRVLELAHLFEDLSFDAYLVINPYYTKTNTSGLLKYFTYIADNVTKPIILYNVPKRTGMEIPLPVIQALSYHPNIVGIKDASGNAIYQQEIARMQRPDFYLYGGDDTSTLISYGLGAKGMISVISNAFPREMKLIYDSYNKDKEISKTTFYKLLDLLHVMYEEVSPIGIKYVLYLLGYDTLSLRKPLDEPSKELKFKIKTELLKLKE